MGHIKEDISLKTLMEQVICVNQFLGVFPQEISGSTLSFRPTSFCFIKTIINLIILSLYAIFLQFQFLQALLSGKSIIILVEIWLWTSMTLIPILILLLCIFKRNQFTYFFDTSNRMKNKLQGFVDCQLAVNYSRSFYKFYVFLAIISATLGGIESYLRPKKIVSLLYYVPAPEKYQIILHCTFQVYLNLITAGALSFVEVLCPTLARSVSNSIFKIIDNMVVHVRANTKFEDLETKEVGLKDKNILSPFINYEKGGTGPIMAALERFGLISEKQKLVNCIFGSILGLNTTWLVVTTCLLFFTEIRIFNPRDKVEIPVDSFTLIVVIWNGCSTCIRLIMILISIGNVYHASEKFESAVMSSLIFIKRPREIDLQLIQIHLAANQLNRNGFSAGGFFIYSRGTILYVISIIATYLVFLLQA